MASKGQNFKQWTAKEKYKIIKSIINLETSLSKVGKETGISNSLLHSWINLYKKNGMQGLISKKKPGNLLAKYYNKKNLNKEEQLEYENIKLRIENEMLKKVFLMKEDDTYVKFMK